MTEGARFAGRDIVWFIDNETVCASAVRGTSSMQEVSAILDASIVCLSRQNTRVWYEWIDSKSNPSDGLSRLGINCPVARRLCGTHTYECHPLSKVPSAEELQQLMMSNNSGTVEACTEEKNGGHSTG